MSDKKKADTGDIDTKGLISITVVQLKLDANKKLSKSSRMIISDILRCACPGNKKEAVKEAKKAIRLVKFLNKFK